MGVPRRLLSIAFAAAVATGGARAGAQTLDGIVFSDELGGFTVIGVSGSGTLDDPFVVVEEITGPTSAVLVVHGLSVGFGNRIGTYHPTGFALRKVVTNLTRFAWTIVDFELRQDLRVPSDTLDGLSFGQGASSGRPFLASRFDRTSEITEPVDFVTFYDGLLRPGETATFDVVITDTTPVSKFYLIQRPNRPVASAATVAARRPGASPW